MFWLQSFMISAKSKNFPANADAWKWIRVRSELSGNQLRNKDIVAAVKAHGYIAGSPCQAQDVRG